MCGYGLIAGVLLTVAPVEPPRSVQVRKDGLSLTVRLDKRFYTPADEVKVSFALRNGTNCGGREPGVPPRSSSGPSFRRPSCTLARCACKLAACTTRAQRDRRRRAFSVGSVVASVRATMDGCRPPNRGAVAHAVFADG